MPKVLTNEQYLDALRRSQLVKPDVLGDRKSVV